MNMKISIFGILLLVAGILAAVALFLDWWSVTFLGVKASVTGWEFFSDGDGYRFAFIPVVLLVLAIVTILGALLEFTGLAADMNMIIKIVAIVVGILIIVLSMVVISDGFSYSGWAENLAIGFYLSVVAGALIAVASLLSLLKVLPEPA